MTIVLAEGDGLGGGLDCLDVSVVIGLLSEDQGIDGLEAMDSSNNAVCAGFWVRVARDEPYEVQRAKVELLRI